MGESLGLPAGPIPLVAEQARQILGIADANQPVGALVDACHRAVFGPPQ